MRPEEQQMKFKRMPSSEGKNILVPKLRGGRPGQVIPDKKKYDRKRERQRFRRDFMPVASVLRDMASSMGRSAFTAKAGEVTFDGILRLSIDHDSKIKALQEKISDKIPGQVPLVTRYIHVTLAGSQILKPFKAVLKGEAGNRVGFDPYKGALSFEDKPHIAEEGDKKSTFVYADAQTQKDLKDYVEKYIYSQLGIEPEKRKFHLTLTNETGFGPHSVGRVWDADKGEIKDL